MAAQRSLEHALRFQVGDRSLTATLRLEPGFPEDEATADALRGYLDSKGVKRERVDDAAVGRMADAAQAGFDEPIEEVVARGVEPEEGRDARLVLEPDLREAFERIRHRRKLYEQRLRSGAIEGGESPEDPSTVAADDEGAAGDDQAVDFREQSAFVIVERSRTLGRIEPALDGVDGEDIFGKAIVTTQGRALSMTLGAGVKDAGESRGLISTQPGRLVVNETEIRVEPRLEIHGAVDFSTGNIDFPGDVEVTGGVRDQFVVKAGGELSIGDLIEAARIEGGSDVVIKRGMAAREQGRLDIRGKLTAHYLDAVSGRVDGDVEVSREINGSTLRIGGKLESPSAAVLGGEIWVAKRTEVNQIGGVGGIETHLLIGTQPELDAYIGKLDAVAERVARRARAAQERLQTLEANISKLTATQAEELTELQFEVARGEEVREKANIGRRRLIEAIESSTHAVLAVRQAIHESTVVWFRGWMVDFHDTLKGPISIEPDEEGIPRYRPLKGDGAPKPLSVVATLKPDDRIPPLPKLDEQEAAPAQAA